MTTTIIPARERAQAPIGLPYIAPLFWNKWFRWDGSPASGHYQLARLIEDEGFEHREFAKLVGMGESTLSTRLNPKPEQKNNEWRHYEITAICRELHIPQEQIGEYFFPKVEKGA